MSWQLLMLPAGQGWFCILTGAPQNELANAAGHVCYSIVQNLGTHCQRGIMKLTCPLAKGGTAAAHSIQQQQSMQAAHGAILFPVLDLIGITDGNGDASASRKASKISVHHPGAPSSPTTGKRFVRWRMSGLVVTGSDDKGHTWCNTAIAALTWWFPSHQPQARMQTICTWSSNV